MDGIFISYRRDDAAGYAGRLSDRLKAQFGADRVFMDVEGIEPGTDFVVAIEQAVGSCRVLIVLIGDEWLNIRDAQGRRRLDDPHDFIRLEIAAALKRDIRVVPVVLDRATMPGADDLPDELKPLARRQAIAIQHQQWDASTATLIQALQKLLGEKAGEGGAGAVRWSVAAGIGLLAVGAGAWWAWRNVPQPPIEEEEVGLLAAASPAASAPAPVMDGTGGGRRASSGSASAPGAPRPPETVVAAAPVPAPHAASSGPSRPPLPASVPPVTRAAPPTVPASAPTPAPAAAPAPAPPVVRSPDSRLPAVGQSWTYQVRGKWPTSPNRTVVIRVNQVNGDMVVDSLQDPAMADPVQRRSRAGQGGFVSWPGIGAEFSPYLVAGEIGSWRGRGFPTPDVDGQWTQWHSSGEALGRESVMVPAGRFEAVKVEVWSNRMATGGQASAQLEPVRIHYLVWYAPEVRRYVRLQRRVMSAAGQEIERDVFELVSRQGG